MNVLSSRLQRELDYVWRPIETPTLKAAYEVQHQEDQFKTLNQQLKKSSAFVKHVTSALTKKFSNLEDESDVHCFTCMYNVIPPTRPANDNPAAIDEYDNEDFEEYEGSSSAKQWTSVISVINNEEEEENSKIIMVLKAPDSTTQFSRDSLISILDIAESLGCHHVYVAINKMMSPAIQRIQITKGFMNVGFQMQHPRVMSVDGHVVLGYEF